MMKKYNRIHTRLERVYNKLKSNENLAFYQFDPLLNEIEYIDYKKYPSIVIVKNLNWEYEILDDDFTTSNIVNFIKSKIKIEKVEEISQESLINSGEMEWKLNSIKKSKYELKLIENKDSDFTELNTGLRRLGEYYKHDHDQMFSKMMKNVMGDNDGNDDDDEKHEEDDVEYEDDIDENEYLKNSDL
jgi:hypothetical protein